MHGCMDAWMEGLGGWRGVFGGDRLFARMGMATELRFQFKLDRWLFIGRVNLASQFGS